MKKTKISFTLLLPLVLVIISGIQSGRKGTELSRKEREIYELMQSNEQIQMQIVKSSSLITLSENSDELGFIVPTNVVYLDKSLAVAKLP